MAINKPQIKELYITNFLAEFEVLSIKVGEAYWPRPEQDQEQSRPIGPSYP